MANDLVAAQRRDVAVAGNPWADAARDVETGTYLKFNGNDGRWSFGQDDDDLPEGSRVTGDMESLAFGWTCWVEGAVEEEVYVAVVDGRPPAEHTLQDYGPYDDDDGWRESAKLSLVLESYGDDDQDEAVGTALLWKTSTGGQVRQIRKLAGAYGRVFAQHPGEFPIVELGAESYAPRNKKHGKKKWSPTLKIVGWMTADELEGLAGVVPGDDGADEPETPARGRAAKEEPPARGRRAAPADDGDDEQDEAPARGRGRRAEPAEEEERPARGRRAAPADDGDDEQDEAPARGRGRRAEPADDEQDEAPARGRGRRAAPADDEGDEGEAPAPRGRSRGRDADPVEDEGDEAEAPAPRGRSANRRLRKFD